MTKKTTSKHQQEEYKRYQQENRWEKNKIRRLARHCQHFPNDKQAQEKLDKANFNYTRNSFKHNKQVPKVARLRDLPRDERETMAAQLKGLIDRGDLVVRRQ